MTGLEIRVFALGAAAIVFSLMSAASAHEYTQGNLKIIHPWARETPAGAVTAAAYLKIVNTGAAAVRFTGAETPAAQRVEIHVMTMDGGVMRMRPTAHLDIAPGATVDLNPGGIHLMLIGLKRRFAREATIPMTLNFAGGKTIPVELHVESMGGAEPMEHRP